MTVRGSAGPKDEPAGLKLISEGADAGISDAQKDLANFYDRGIGTPVNNDEAVYWYNPAIDSNLL